MFWFKDEDFGGVYSDNNYVKNEDWRCVLKGFGYEYSNECVYDWCVVEY